jgi:hypothetical protein
MANEVEIRVTGTNQSAPAVEAARKSVKGLGDEVTKTGQTYTKAGKDAAGFAQQAKTAGAVAAGVLSADIIRTGAARAVEGIKSTIAAASNLNESVNAVNDVFHQNSAVVEQWGKNNSEAFGLSLREFNQYATPLGAMLKNAGLSEDQVTDQTIKLTQRAADMASVFNVDVGSALEAISAGLRGEQDPLEKFGVSLSAAKVQARALADSGKQNASALSAQELATARLNIIYDQTNDTAGDFQNTSTGLANATRKANAAIEDAKANLGAAFLPLLGEAATLTGKFATSMSTVPVPLAVTVGGLAALGAAFVVVAPKIRAAKGALDEMVNSDSRVVSTMGRTISVLGRVAAGLAAVQVIGQIVGSKVFKQDLDPNIEAAANSLAQWNRQAALAGEGAREFGADAEDLTRALQTSAGDAGILGGGTKFTNQVDRIGASVLGLSDYMDGLDATTKQFDQTLAYMASNGQAGKALDIIQIAADKAGISVDQLKSLLPQYSAAVQVAATKTGAVGDAATAAAADLDAMNRSFHDTIDSAFATADAEDKLANDVQRLADQVKSQKEAHDKGADSLDRNTQAGRDNAAMVRDLLGDVADLATQYQKAGKPVDGLKKSLEDQLRAMGFSAAQIKIYTSQLDDMIQKLDALPPVVVTDVYVRQHGSAPSLGYAHGDATGGVGGGSYPYAASGGLPRQGGTPTVMNEQGRELVHLPWGATVYSAGQSASMAERGDMLDGRGPGGGRGGPTELLVRGDGSRFAELLIYVLQQAVSAQGGQAGILGIRFAPTG